jgi:cytoskeletal protein RodZ
MKKVLSVLMVLAILFAFAGCSSKTDEEVANTDTSSTVEQGDSENTSATVGENESEDENENASSTSSANQTTNKSENTTASGNSTATTQKATTKNQTTTTTKKDETTTKRKIKLTVEYPYHNAEKTKVTIEYKLSKDSDKKYKVLVEDEEITLDKLQTKTYEIKDQLVGDVDIRITLDGVELLENEFVISGKDSETKIQLAAGVEMLDGGMD